MAALLCGSTPSSTRTQCRGKDNHDRLMALYHTGTDVKRHLLQYHLSQKNLDLADFLYGRYQFLQPDDIKRALLTQNFQLSDLGIYSIDKLLSDQCFDLFWDSCLDKDKTSLENILNRYKEHLYSLYKTSGRVNNGSARNARKREYLSKNQWEYLYKGPEIEDIKENDFQLSSTFPNKGLTIQSFDDDMNFVLLSNVCPLYQSLQVVTTNQRKLSRIAVEHEINNETFDEIWKLMATHLKPISSYCICETYFDHTLDRIKKRTFKCIQAQEYRKFILESTFHNKAFSEDAEFMTRVQKELNLIEAENTKDLVTKLCDKEIPVLLVRGQYIAGSYTLGIENTTRQELESCQSVCSRQATDKKPLSTSRNIDVVEEQKSIDRHSYLKFVCLIQDVAKNVLVGVLRGRLPGANFGNTLNGMKKKILLLLNRNQEQLVYPDGLKYAGDLTDMDVSLLYIILRNLGTICPHQNGWGKEPEEHDHSISANIDRIRMAKNMIVSHSSTCSLGYAQFNNQWETIRRCCVELGGELYEEQIDNLLTTTFNRDLEQQYSEKLENLKEMDMQTDRYCRKLEELLDSILINLQKLPAFKGNNNGTTYEEVITHMILQIKGNSLPCKTEIEEKIGNYKNNNMQVTSVENGSIVIRIQMFPSAFQSFGHVLAVIDKLLQHAFSARSVSEENIAVSIILSVDMHQFSEAVHKQPLFTPENTKMYSEEEEDSIWLFDVLESIGVNDEYRRTCQQTGITIEILQSFQALMTSNNYGSSREATVTQLQNDGCRTTSQRTDIICEITDTFENTVTCYNMGIAFEGTVTPDEPHDLDFIVCQEWFSVIEDIAKAEKNKFSLFIVREPETPAGYVKLQLVGINKPLTSTDWPSVKDMIPNLSHCFKTDKLKRLVLCDFLMVDGGGHMLSRLENKPALKQENYYGLNTDTVISYRGKIWPSMANEWLTRSRLYGWPTKDMIQDLKSLGFFVVRKGHPFSSEKNLEWRISLTLQERKLITSLTDVQHKCYVFLKMINRDIINLECITTYHWKTCLFYVIEGNKEDIWDKRLLFHCVKLCIKQMLIWVKNGVCPNYFIPAENLFDGRFTDSLQRTTSEKELVELLNSGFSCLSSIHSNNISEYFKSRNFITSFSCLQAKSEQAYNKALYIAKTSTFRFAHSVFNQSILAYYYYQTNDVHSKFINFLWLLIDRIQNISTIFEHTADEVKSAQALLLPCIYTCLASTISAFAFKITQCDTRDILLLGSLSYLFINGDLSGRLKLISVLLAAELYADCEWHLDQLETIDLKGIPSFCLCRHCAIGSYFPQKYMNTSTVSTCLSFLQIELPIIPDALKYEMFRFVGISIHEIYNIYIVCQWHYRAVVDSNIYFFLLKYLLKKKLRKVEDCSKAIHSIINLIHGENVRHRDVAFNLLTSICISEFNTLGALLYLTDSWTTMISSDLCFIILSEEMKQKQYLYNAAKIHALVILYKTWFARIPSDVYFCFQCIRKSDIKLQKCSRCKVSTYCDKQCQRKNWKIHKKTCKMARRHHILFSTSVIPFAFH